MFGAWDPATIVGGYSALKTFTTTRDTEYGQDKVEWALLSQGWSLSDNAIITTATAAIVKTVYFDPSVPYLYVSRDDFDAISNIIRYKIS